MRRLRNFLSRRASDRRLLLASVFWLACFRLGLWLVPFRGLKSVLPRLAGEALESRRQPGVSARKIAWAIDRGSRCVPFASCLTQALAAQVLMSRYGYASEIHIGVTRKASNDFAAHAWVESQGEMLVGGAGAADFRRIVILESATR